MKTVLTTPPNILLADSWKIGFSMSSVEWSHGKSVMNARPRPRRNDAIGLGSAGVTPAGFGLWPETDCRRPGEGEPVAIPRKFGSHRCSHCMNAHRSKSATETGCGCISRTRTPILPLLGERDGVRADVRTNLDFRPHSIFSRRHPLRISKKRKSRSRCEEGLNLSGLRRPTSDFRSEPRDPGSCTRPGFSDGPRGQPPFRA